MTPEPRFRVLGPLEVTDAAGAPVVLGSGRLRTLMTLLIADANHVISVDRLVDRVWAGDPPPSAVGTLQVYMSQLRRLLDPSRRARTDPGSILTRAPGYLLSAAPGEVDTELFETLVTAGERLIEQGPDAPATGIATTTSTPTTVGAPTGTNTAAAAALDRADRALSLWRGRPYADVAADPDLAGQAEAMADLRLRALDCRAAALLGCGRPGPAAAVAEALVREQPLRERYWARLMLAAYRDGRQADALRAFQDCRRILDEELGLAPGLELTGLQTAILRRDPVLGEIVTLPAATPAASPSPAGDAGHVRSVAGSPATAEPPAGEPATGGADGGAADRGGGAGVPEVVGRERELGALQDAVATAASGTGAMVLLEGEAGIGKTTLAEAATRMARERRMRAVWARTVEDLGAPPFWLWEQVLQDLGSDTRILAGTTAGGGPWDGTVRNAPAWGVSAQDTPPPKARPQPWPATRPSARSTQDLTVERFRLLESINAAVMTAARTGPLLLVLDDLQWADAGSLQALRLLAGRLRNLPCAIVVTCRPTDALDRAALDDTLAALGRERTVRRLPLSGFSIAEVESLLSAHGDRRFDPALLRERTAGNPFFLTELVRLQSDAVLRPAPGPPPGPGAEVEVEVTAEGTAEARSPVPATVRDVVERRFDRLPERTRILVRLAALAGSEIDVRVLARAVRMDPAEVVIELEPALRSGLLRHDEETWGWRFAHDISRDALSARLSPQERPPLHALLADAIEAVHGDDLAHRLDDLARHRFHAALGTASEPAFRMCSQAADEARRRLAFDQAARHRQRALAVLPAGADEADRRYRTLIALTEDRRLTGDLVGAAAALDGALRLAGSAGDRDRLAGAAAVLGEVRLWNWRNYGTTDPATIALLRDLLTTTTEPHRRAELLGTLAVELYYGPERAEGERMAAEAVGLARRTGDPALLGRTLNNYVIAAWVPDREPERLAALDESLRLAGTGLPIVTEVIALMHRLSVHLRFGRIREYEDDLDRCHRLAQTLGMPEIETQDAYQQAGYAMLRGDDDLARDLIERAYRQHRRTSMWGAQFARIVQLVALDRARGRVSGLVDELVAFAAHDENGPLRPTAVLTLVESGEHTHARLLLERWGLDRPTKRWDWASDFELAQLGEVAAALGAPDPARLYEELYPYRDRLVVIGTALACTGPVHQVLAALARRLDRPGVADDHLERAGRAYGTNGANGPSRSLRNPYRT